MAAKKSASTSLAKTQSSSMQNVADFDVADLMGDGQQQQFQRDDLVIPFLRVLQSMSPQVKKSDPAFIKGAEEGMFFNSASQKMWDGEGEGILVVPVAYMRSYTEWNKLENGGGLVKDHGDNGALLALCTRDEKGRNITPSGHELVDAALYYVLIVDDTTGEYDTAAFLMKGTQWKKARQWNTLMQKMMVEVNGQRFKPATFYHAWRLRTVPEKNEQGSWYGVSIPSEPESTVFELPNGAKMYREASDFRKTIAKGEVRVKLDEPETAGDEDDAI